MNAYWFCVRSWHAEAVGIFGNLAFKDSGYYMVLELACLDGSFWLLTCEEILWRDCWHQPLNYLK